ncbi:hypothetical protein GCM10020331_063160 [Ectobacillus funiculus]
MQVSTMNKNKEKGKNYLFVIGLYYCLMIRIFTEDAMFANCDSEDLPADGVITAIGKIHGRTVCVMANDSTVKAGSWGSRTVEKNLAYSRNSREVACSSSLFS